MIAKAQSLVLRNIKSISRVQSQVFTVAANTMGGDIIDPARSHDSPRSIFRMNSRRGNMARSVIYAHGFSCWYFCTKATSASSTSFTKRVVLFGIHCGVGDWWVMVVRRPSIKKLGTPRSLNDGLMESKDDDCGCYFGTVSTRGCNDCGCNTVGLVTVFTR